MKNKYEKICILGAGISGLTAAYYLMKKGYMNVTMLEKEERVGGKCYSILYKGKKYEMGAMMGVPSYYNINSIMNEFGIINKGPLLYSDFFDIYGNKVSQVPLNEINDFRKQFKTLMDILKKYDKLYEPGFSNISEELCISFSEWCANNEIPLATKVYGPPFTSFGYGYLDEIPAAYVLKFLDYKTLLAFIDITHLITFPDGIDVLCKKIADCLTGLKLGIKIKKIVRENKIKVETQYETMEFDKLIVTTPLDETVAFMDSTDEEKRLFSKIQNTYFNVFAYSISKIPKVSGYIPYNFTSDRVGHIMVWYYRFQDTYDNDLITVYSLCRKEDSPSKCKKIMDEDLKRLGIVADNLLMQRRWKYFPHVSSEDLRNGFYKDLDKLQMKKNTIYAGEILDFSNLEHCSCFSKYIVDTYF